MSKLRVLIVESHPPLRRLLSQFLETLPDIQVVGQATTGDDAISMARSAEPDMVILDSGLPGLNGFITASLIKDTLPGTSVVIVTDDDSEEYRVAAAGCGASAYVAKERVHHDLLAVIRSILK